MFSYCKGRKTAQNQARMGEGCNVLTMRGNSPRILTINIKQRSDFSLLRYRRTFTHSRTIVNDKCGNVFVVSHVYSELREAVDFDIAALQCFMRGSAVACGVGFMKDVFWNDCDWWTRQPATCTAVPVCVPAVPRYCTWSRSQLSCMMVLQIFIIIIGAHIRNQQITSIRNFLSRRLTGGVFFFYWTPSVHYIQVNWFLPIFSDFKIIFAKDSSQTSTQSRV